MTSTHVNTQHALLSNCPGASPQVWYCTRLPSIIRTGLADTQIQKATFILLQNETDQQTGIRTHCTTTFRRLAYTAGDFISGGGGNPPPGRCLDETL